MKCKNFYFKKFFFNRDYNIDYNLSRNANSYQQNFICTPEKFSLKNILNLQIEIEYINKTTIDEILLKNVFFLIFYLKKEKIRNTKFPSSQN